jgi:capsular polysaccharide transport system permease protein
MIKKIIQLTWYEKQYVKDEKPRTLRKNFARLKRHGFSGMKERLDKDYALLEENRVAKSRVNAKYSIWKVRLVFLLIFLLLNGYYLFIKSELYESSTALIVRNMGTPSPASSLGLSLLGMGNSSQLKDSMIVQEYLKSLDMYKQVDKKFALTKHYESNAIDFIERLSKNATQEQILAMYNKHLIIYYDETSGILHISFLHVDPKKAKEILEFLVKRVDYQINEFNRRKAEKQLKFVESEFKKAKEKLDEASLKLEAYQNKHLLLDPTAEATSKSAIISELEAKLAQKKLEYATKRRYLNSKNFELISLRNDIREIKRSIARAKSKLTGKDKDRLNKVVFAYQQLKMQLEFATEVYKNALLQLETTKIEVAKNDKTLSIVSKPNLPDGYSYPKKMRVFITILILTLLAYGIFIMLGTIIKDHKE